MSKVICEYCGTMYTSEEGECPVCGHIDTPEAAQPGQEPAEKNAGEPRLPLPNRRGRKKTRRPGAVRPKGVMPGV